MKKENVKEKLQQTIKNLLKEKTISRITIKEITDTVGIQRQTFYYHYNDIYDLAFNMLDAEIKTNLSHLTADDTLNSIIYKLFSYVKVNRMIFLNFLANTNTEVVLNYLNILLYQIVSYVLNLELKKHNLKISKQGEQELLKSYTYYISGLLNDWFKSGSEDFDETQVNIIITILKSNFEGAVKNLSTF